MKDYLWLLFVVMTILSWGTYVPVVHEGQGVLGGGTPKNGAFQAFICVSGAYLVLGLLVLFSVMFGKYESFSTNPNGYTVAFLGGVLGAVGALGIVLALKNGGTPVIVPALVFAGAPIVNVLVSMAWHPPAESPKPLFYVGLLMAAVGAGLVLYSKPGAPKKSPTVEGKPVAVVSGDSKSAH